MSELSYEDAKAAFKLGGHKEATGKTISVGSILWDNDLHLVQVTELAAHIEKDHRNPCGWEAWHATLDLQNGGRGNTSDGGRLVFRNPFTGKLASDEAARLGLI